MRLISFFHLDYILAGKDYADIIRIVESNGDVRILIVHDDGIGDLDLAPDDVLISADTPNRQTEI